MSRWSVPLILALAGCLQFSPYDLPTDASQRDVHRRSLAALAASPSPLEPLRFGVVGDSHHLYGDLADAVAALNGRADLAFVVQMGDVTDYGLPIEFETTNRLLGDLRVPYFVVVGNHDLVGNGQDVYERMFGSLDLAFTCDRIRFVLLNTNSLEFDFSPAVPDLEWLAAQLAPGADHDRAIVLAHVPPDAFEFAPAAREPFLALLRGAGATVSLHGHDHRYDVRELDGVTFVGADLVGNRNYLVVTAAAGGGFDVEDVWF